MSNMMIISCLLALVTSAAAARGACNILPSSIICSGPLVDNDALRDLTNQLITRYQDIHFLQIMLTGTSLAAIPAGTFKGITFENLLIDANQDLVTIDPKAFDEQTQCATLMIISNPQLNDNQIYWLVRRLNIYNSIDFEFNGLKVIAAKEVPANAFSQPSQVQASNPAPDPHIIMPAKLFFRELTLAFNSIVHLASNAFHSIYSCSEVYLNNNKISRIEAHAFNLLSNITSELHLIDLESTNSDTLTIHLDHNELTSESFAENFLMMDASALKVTLVLSYNSIKTLKESVFRPLLEHMVYIDIDGNEGFDCLGHEWLHKNPRYFLKVRGTNCW